MKSIKIEVADLFSYNKNKSIAFEQFVSFYMPDDIYVTHKEINNSVQSACGSISR